MSASVIVREVTSKADFELFLRFPWRLYKHDPHWVPQLVSHQRTKLDKRKNPTWQHLDGVYYLAWRGDRPVGTIAAFINHRHNSYHQENIGFFGLFEVEDDQVAADALLTAAADWVAARGCDAIRGPASFSTNEECGILIEGFDGPPVLLMPYNYPYYQRLLETSPGFEKVMDLYSYYITLDGIRNTSGKLEQLQRITERNNTRRRIIVRGPDMKNLKQEFVTLKNIYNNAWDKNWGFVPFSDAELDDLVENLGQFFEPRLTFFAEVAGKPVGFILGIPDMNQPLRHAYPRPGKPEALTLLQVLWHWKLRPKISRFRIMLMGVEAEYRGLGVEGAMFLEMYRAASAMPDWTYADGGWVLETNIAMQRLVDAYNSRLYRRYRFYQRSLAADTP